MRKNRWSLAFGLGILFVAVVACNFSATTANISSLKVGKDADVGTESDTFGPNDTIYAVAVISNASENLKVTGRLSAESVDGMDSGPIPGAEKMLDMQGAGTAKFNFTGGTKGWPKGKYKMEVIMKNESGEEKDKKSATVTVS
jgi:hypothetical protein